MPGDPKECRQHAERCGELARLASTQEARETFLSLQMTWIRLAMELQQAGALIEAVQELEEQPVKAAEGKPMASQHLSQSYSEKTLLALEQALRDVWQVFEAHDPYHDWDKADERASRSDVSF